MVSQAVDAPRLTEENMALVVSVLRIVLYLIGDQSADTSNGALCSQFHRTAVDYLIVGLINPFLILLIGESLNGAILVEKVDVDVVMFA